MGDLSRLRLYCSDQTHSSVEKAAIVLGVGQEGVRKIPSDAEFKMDVKALTAAIEEDRKNGWLPFAVVATVGTTSSTSVDPVFASEKNSGCTLMLHMVEWRELFQKSETYSMAVTVLILSSLIHINGSLHQLIAVYYTHVTLQH